MVSWKRCNDVDLIRLTHSLGSFCVSNNHYDFDDPNKSRNNKKKRAMKWKMTTIKKTHRESEKKTANNNNNTSYTLSECTHFFVVTKYTIHFTFIATTVLNLWINCRLSLVTVIQCCTYYSKCFHVFMKMLWVVFFIFSVCCMYHCITYTAHRFECMQISHMPKNCIVYLRNIIPFISQNTIFRPIKQLNWFIVCVDNVKRITMYVYSIEHDTAVHISYWWWSWIWTERLRFTVCVMYESWGKPICNQSHW